MRPPVGWPRSFRTRWVVASRPNCVGAVGCRASSRSAPGRPGCAGLRAEAAQLVHREPVAGGALAVEQPGGGEDQRAGADRGRPGARAVVRARSHSSICPPARCGDLAGTAGDEHDRPGSGSSASAPRPHREHAVVGAHGPGLGGDERDARAGQAAEHLVGPDRVERGEAVVEEDRDVHLVLLFRCLEVGAWRPRATRSAAMPTTRCGSGGGTRPGPTCERAQERAAHRLGACRSRRRRRPPRSARALSSSRAARRLEAHALDVARRA